MSEIDVLVPTFERPTALAVTLTSLGSQTLNGFRLVVSDQSAGRPPWEQAEVRTALRYVEARGNGVECHRHLPRRGIAEHRESLLERARARYAVFIDDDVICEPDLLERLLRAIERERCGFVGSAPIGLSYVADVRPDQEPLELWEGPVEPEQVTPDSHAWQRHLLHNAANLWHVQERLGVSREEARLYRVAWVGGCVLYDVAKLRSVGGFQFWRELPSDHVGEDVLAQLRVMARYGGAALIPSGAYHQELPTTLPHRSVDAPLALHAS